MNKDEDNEQMKFNDISHFKVVSNIVPKTIDEHVEEVNTIGGLANIHLMKYHTLNDDDKFKILEDIVYSMYSQNFIPIEIINYVLK